MKILLHSSLFLLLLFCSCKKFLSIDPPPNQATTDKVFLSDAMATAAVNGIYSEMMNSSAQFSASGITLYAGMCADELITYSPGSNDPFINNDIIETVHPVIETYFWNAAYKYIYSANLSYEKLASSAAVTETTRRQLQGEALFIRSFCYFQLLQLFGDVPLVISSDYRINESLPRTARALVYQQLVTDLIAASTLLPTAYSGNERVRPTRWAALALLARTYLYTGDWVNAENTATQVIQSGLHTLTPGPGQVFLKNSTEAIWQLPPSNVTVNTWEGNQLLPATSGATPHFILRPELVNSFEAGDLRWTFWVASRTFQSQLVYHPTKYKVRGNNAPITEYYMVLRLAEQYLLRAEARLHQNKLTECATDLNMIRSRAGLAASTASNFAELQLAIERERQIEFMLEWGHRWYDLKRTNRATTVLGPVKGTTWQASDMLWPVPIKQLQANPFLVQNPGY